MYRHLYGLTEKPFQISTDPAFLWLGGKHREALAVLVYGVRDSRGFLLLSGGVGTGKTTLIRSLLGQLDKNVVVATVQDPGLTPMAFFNFIAAAYGMRRRYTNKVDFLFDFEKFLRKTRAAGRSALMIVDEAQRLDQTLLEEIRLLSNIEDSDQKLLNVFFVGQEEFLDIIASPENRALKQRITINYHLESLSPDETKKLVRHRLKVAGATREIFTPDAFPLIHEFSQGAPRLINILCDHALLTGFVKDIATIGAATITECIEDLMLPGEHPRHLPVPLPETVEAPRSVAATVTAGMMLQNEPPPPRRARWPWSAAAGLLLAVGVGVSMEQGWWPLSTFRDIARVTTDTVEKQPASKKESVAAVPVSPAEPDGDEPPRTTSRPPDVSPQNLARNEAAHDSAGYSGAEKAIGASRPSRPADTDVAVAPKTAPPPQAPPEPARVDDRPRETPLIGHEVPAPLPPAPLAVDQSPGASVTAGPKQQAPPPQNIRPAPEVGGAQTSTASPRSNATAATEETIFERQGPDAVVITTVPSPAANGADATNARPARAVAGETEDGHPASAMVETSQSAAFVPPPFPVAPTDDKAEKTPVSASQDVTAAPNAAPATSPPEIPNTDIARPSAMAAVHTDAVPPKAPQPETPAAATPSPSPSLPEGLEHPVPDRTAALPQTPVASYSTEDRLRGFIRAYAQAYESRDLERFRLFFTDDAVENGRSFSKVLPTYRKNFAALSGLEYTIKLMSWKKKDAAGGITLKGTFDVRYHMPNRDWRTTQGKITMDLVSNGGAYRVKRLNYSKK